MIKIEIFLYYFYVKKEWLAAGCAKPIQYSINARHIEADAVFPMNLKLTVMHLHYFLFSNINSSGDFVTSLPLP